MAGFMKSLLREVGDDGRAVELAAVNVTLTAGSNISEVGPGWTVVGHARTNTGAGALGNLTLSVDPGGTLTTTSDAATDVSSIAVLLAKGGATRSSIP